MIGEYIAVAPYAGAPTKLTGFTKHGIEQILGKNGHGVTTDAVIDALKKPTSISKVVDAQGRVSYLYRGKDATVVLNQKGEIVTAWAKNRGAWRFP